MALIERTLENDHFFFQKNQIYIFFTIKPASLWFHSVYIPL